MQPARKNLSVIRTEIKDSLLQVLEDARTTDLSDVKSIIYGNRATIGSVTTPTIWVLPQPHSPELKGGRQMWHNFNFDIAALIKHTKPEVGVEQSEDLSARLYDVIMADRSLGGLVHDIVPTAINPAFVDGTGAQFYWAAVSFSFRTLRFE